MISGIDEYKFKHHGLEPDIDSILEEQELINDAKREEYEEGEEYDEML